MLDLLMISASIATAQPAAPLYGFDLDAVIARTASEDVDDDERWTLPALIDLPEEEQGARFRLRGKKIKFSMPI